MAIDINTLMPVAQVLKSYGTEGEMTASLFTSIPEDTYLTEPVFIICDGLPVPFFITSIAPKGSTKALLKIEDIETIAQAEALVGTKLLMLEEVVDEEEDEEIYDEYALARRLVGYTLVNQDKKEIGIIDAVQNFAGNICLEIGDHMIPFHLDLVLKLNKRKKILSLTIPEGLI